MKVPCFFGTQKIAYFLGTPFYFAFKAQICGSLINLKDSAFATLIGRAFKSSAC